ncbi:restriction endonuclease subunit S [Helicobacter pylori]|uniref:Type I restriction enzyme, S subunit n=2 Tax=Helicobacter pylori TaxID=210 RepID=I9ZC10_HELPX|nr:restriction endonuclease subunit S [Helicobacter pylori]EJB33698.1 type I restriction enzyme, S subunit [Helicobacter pylori NQ4053]
MHKIEQLLHTLAPKGVGFRKLGEVCESTNKKTLKISEVSEVKNKGMYPVINSGRDLYGYYHDFNNDGENITIASRGEYAGFINYFNEKFFAGGLCYPYKVKDTNELLTKFLYFYLKTNEIQIMENLVFRGSIPALNKADIETLTIPIPPLEIQQEIVKILDAFTELNTELNTELKARKKQYQYYQNMLLDFNDINQNHKDAKEKLLQKPYPKRLKTLLQTLAPKGVGFRKLGEVCEILDNRRIPIAKNKRNPGIYPYYGANGIQDYIDSYIFDGDFVLVGEDGSVINKDNTPVVNWASGKIWVNNHAHVLQTKNELKLKFLYFYLQTIDVSYCVAGTPPKINQENLKKITIPIPPLEIQQEIVKILDQFSLLTTDLLAGIPAEIKARKKQYEYYREKLLTFKPLTPNKEVKKC